MKKMNLIIYYEYFLLFTYLHDIYVYFTYSIFSGNFVQRPINVFKIKLVKSDTWTNIVGIGFDKLNNRAQSFEYETLNIMPLKYLLEAEVRRHKQYKAPHCHQGGFISYYWC